MQSGDGSSGLRGGDLGKQHGRNTTGNSHTKSGDETANEERIQITRGGQGRADDEEERVKQQSHALAVLLGRTTGNQTSNPGTKDGEGSGNLRFN